MSVVWFHREEWQVRLDLAAAYRLARRNPGYDL
jgi:hypothetical protein